MLRQRAIYGLQALVALALPFLVFRLDPPSPIIWSIAIILIAVVFAFITSAWSWLVVFAVAVTSIPNVVDLDRHTIPFLWGAFFMSLGVLVAVLVLQPLREPAMFRPRSTSRRPVLFAIVSVVVAGVALTAFVLFVNRPTEELLTGIGQGPAGIFAEAPSEVLGADDGTSPTVNVPTIGQPNTEGAGPVVAALEFRRADGRSVVSRDRIYVRDGVDAPTLALGAGRYPQAADPGALGNLAIAGHRTAYGAPFEELGDLSPGDTVTAIDASGASFTYEVVNLRIVGPDDAWVVGPDPLDLARPTLTLTTGDPPQSNERRVVVFAVLRDVE